ncbi:MAG: hypothetical protein ACYSX0_05765 [Planctomycetota bacterium]|jgi:hypothetical protein
MRLKVALILLLLSALARAQDPLVFRKEPYKCLPLEFVVAIPEGWEALQDHTGIVVRSKEQGFMVSREPFLHDPKLFADAWGKVLGAAGVETRVQPAKAGRYQAYRTSWETKSGPGRTIQVWRVYVPEVEMLYNFSFSAPKDADLEPLVKSVLGSFKCTAPKNDKLEFEAQAESLGARVNLRLPKGYAKSPALIVLGGGEGGDYVKTLKGYEKPHIAGSISVSGYDARITYVQEDGSEIPGTNVKKLVEKTFDDSRGKFSKILKRPRTKAARIAGLKGFALTAQALSSKGLPKHVYIYGGKLKQSVLVFTIIVDAREARLYKDIGKQICSKLEIKE